MCERSIVEWCPRSEGNKCGYCKSVDGNCSYGMWAHTLTVEDYQDLIDRGWRRSGHYCYKPIMDVTCCPCYTIKCDAVNFKLGKSQKKTIKRFNQYLKTGEKQKTNDRSTEDQGNDADVAMPEVLSKFINVSKKYVGPAADNIEMEPSLTKSDNSVASSGDNNPNTLGVSESSLSLTLPTSQTKTEEVVLTRKLSPSKAKYLRMERRKKILVNRGLSVEEIQSIMKNSKLRRMPKTKSFEDRMFCGDDNELKHRLAIRLVLTNPESSAFKKTFNLEHQVYCRYQMAVHNDPPTKCTAEQFTRFLCSSPLKVRLINTKSPNYKATATDSWILYRKYETRIHNQTIEDCDYKTFNEFLVHSPLKHSKPPNGPPHGYGSFHLQYWLDGRLIAVGVLDILPKCISSVYFFYDPDLSHLSLGTYSSLREVELTRSFQKTCPELCYYYMGFYIHSCLKMKYKAKLKPSYLLCPETYTWQPIEYSQLLLDKNKYSRLNANKDEKDTNANIDLDQVMVLHRALAMPYSRYKARLVIDDDSLILEYASLVGQPCASRMLLAQ